MFYFLTFVSSEFAAPAMCSCRQNSSQSDVCGVGFITVCDKHWPSVRDLLAPGEEERHVELRGLSFYHRADEHRGYICVMVKEAVVNGGVVLQLPNSHVSIADVLLEGVPGSRQLRTAESAVRCFDKKVNELRDLLLAQVSGRLDWNGMEASPCCFDLRNDALGICIAKMADTFKVFPQAKGSHLTLPWLPGRNLHLSVYTQVSLNPPPPPTRPPPQ